MCKTSKIKLGVLPIKRGFLSLDVAVSEKEKLQKVIGNIENNKVELIYVDDACDRGVLYKDEEIETVVKKFKEVEIDGLFICHCDFGEESVALKVAREFEVPVLLWGNRDKYPNSPQQRGRDTQCGIFACSKVLQRNGITFSYIYNVDVNSQEFADGYTNFLRTVNVVKSLKNLKIAQIGNRPKPFMSVISNEGLLMEKFGIEVVPFSISEILKRVNEMIVSEDKVLKDEVDKAYEKYDCSQITKEVLAKIQALKLVIKNMMEEKGCTAGGLECWSLFPNEIGIPPCMVISELSDLGIPLSCEMDLNGALTSIIAKAVALDEEPVFFADLTIRHPEKDNGELLWHCGSFPYSLHNSDKEPKIVNGQATWELKKGDITILRCDDINGKYKLFSTEGIAVDGPSTTGTYVWFETEDWKKVEEKFVFGPYIHHVAGIYGKYLRALKEATRYLPIEWDDINKGLSSL